MGGEIDGVIELGTAAAARLAGAAVVAVSGFRALAGAAGGAGGPHVVELAVQFFARRREVLQQLNLAVEVDEERLIGSGAGLGIRGEHLVDKLFAGLALVVQGAGDAAAGVNQQAEPEGQVALVSEALDGLRAAVFREREVARLEAGDQRAVLVAHGDGEDDLASLNPEGCGRLVRIGLLGQAGRGQAEDGGREGERERRSRLSSHSDHGAHSFIWLDGRADAGLLGSGEKTVSGGVGGRKTFWARGPARAFTAGSRLMGSAPSKPSAAADLRLGWESTTLAPGWTAIFAQRHPTSRMRKTAG